jgi:hypothetical protein
MWDGSQRTAGDVKTVHVGSDYIDEIKRNGPKRRVGRRLSSGKNPRRRR